MPDGKERVFQVTAPFTKYTPKKVRFTGENKLRGVSVSVYIEKGQDIPDEVHVKLTEKR